MISVLISAYACGPNKGSEPGVGWNWVVNLAKKCNVFVITEGEFKDSIEEALKELPQKDQIHFYYLPVSNQVRRMCWNQGDWRFYFYYKKWQKKALSLAKKIISENKIDIIHQLNMIGFREPGYLWKINDHPFIWGPIGGMNLFPEAYLTNTRIKQALLIKLKNKINFHQIKYHRRVWKTIQRADALISAIPESQKYIKLYYEKDSYLIYETGCEPKNDICNIVKKENEEFNILWVGRFIYSKQLELALYTIDEVKHLNGIRFHILGDGVNSDYYKNIAYSLGLENICTWYGNVPNSSVHQLMRKSHLFFFSSVSEATSTVILEALENYLPVLCFNTCGFGAVINETVGEKIELSFPSKSVHEFADKIVSLYNNRELLEHKSANCHSKIIELSWEEKINQVINIYMNSLTKYGKTLNVGDLNIATDFELSELPEKKLIIKTVNAYSWSMTDKYPEFKKALQTSDILLPDGVSIVFAARLLTGKKIRKVAGADLHQKLLQILNNSGGSCFYLGSSKQTLKRIEERIHKEYPNIQTNTYSPPFKDKLSDDDNTVIHNIINKANPDVVFVGMTAPKQELWIYENKEFINSPVICAIGAVFDFYAGTIKRPPQWMINSGLEWLGRLLSNPKRLWKRYLVYNIVFIYKICKLYIKQKI